MVVVVSDSPDEAALSVLKRRCTNEEQIVEMTSIESGRIIKTPHAFVAVLRRADFSTLSNDSFCMSVYASKLHDIPVHSQRARK